MVIPCDCVGGFSLVTEYSEERLARAFRDDWGHWWTECGDCKGTGKQVDDDCVIGGVL